MIHSPLQDIKNSTNYLRYFVNLHRKSSVYYLLFSDNRDIKSFKKKKTTKNGSVEFEKKADNDGKNNNEKMDDDGTSDVVMIMSTIDERLHIVN